MNACIYLSCLWYFLFLPTTVPTVHRSALFPLLNYSLSPSSDSFPSLPISPYLSCPLSPLNASCLLKLYQEKKKGIMWWRMRREFNKKSNWRWSWLEMKDIGTYSGFRQQFHIAIICWWESRTFVGFCAWWIISHVRKSFQSMSVNHHHCGAAPVVEQNFS